MIKFVYGIRINKMDLLKIRSEIKEVVDATTEIFDKIIKICPTESNKKLKCELIKLKKQLLFKHEKYDLIKVIKDTEDTLRVLEKFGKSLENRKIRIGDATKEFHSLSMKKLSCDILGTIQVML